VSRRLKVRYGERRVISVTPVARGLVAPVVGVALALVSVEFVAVHVRLFLSLRVPLLLIVAVPGLVLVVTRTWRWRSHKVHVTTQRVLVEGGVLHHRRSEVELSAIIATHVDQRFRERLSRRGAVYLETRGGTIDVGVVHHPGALCRVIDQERAAHRDDAALDTVFDFDQPQAHDFETRPRRRRDRR